MSDRAEDDRKDAGGDRESSESTPRVSPLEHAATIVSAVLVAGLLAVLLSDAFRAKTPASFAAKAGPASMVAGAYRVPIDVRNLGDESAKDVSVHVELALPDTTYETDLTIDWLPGRSSRRVLGLFERGPNDQQSATINARVRGFIEP